MPKPDHRLAGGGLMPSTTFLRPAVLDADHHHGRHVGVAAGADQGAEVQIQVGAELQPAVGVRDRQRALDVVGHGLGRRVGQVVQRQDDDVVAHAHAAVLATVAEERGVFADDRHAYHLLVLMFWTWACSPALIGATTLPMSMPYFHTVSPTAMSFSATLWPMGMSGPGDHVGHAVFVHDPAGEFHAGLHAFHYHDGHRVLGVVKHEMNHARS
jgi:hypothetical protein